MAVLKASRTIQNVMEASFSWTSADTMIDINGASTGFSSAAAHTVDVINLPPGACVVSGEIVVTTAFNGSTYPIVVGDSATADRYLTTGDRKAAALVPLVPTGYVSLGESIRLTITPTGSTTAGACTIRVRYTVAGRANEVQAT